LVIATVVRSDQWIFIRILFISHDLRVMAGSRKLEVMRNGKCRDEARRRPVQVPARALHPLPLLRRLQARSCPADVVAQ
jgi:hypothetical protein